MPEPSIEFHTAAVDAIQAGRLDEALTTAENSLTENPKDAETWQLYVIVLNALGHILRLRDENDEALAALNKAVTAEPDLMLAVYEQGMLLADKNRLEEVFENFTRYLKAKPGDPSAVQAVESIRYRMRPETR